MSEATALRVEGASSFFLTRSETAQLASALLAAELFSPLQRLQWIATPLRAVTEVDTSDLTSDPHVFHAIHEMVLTIRTADLLTE